MNMQPTNDGDPQQTVELRIRTMRILWVALFISIVMYYGITLFIGRSETSIANRNFSLILLCASLFATLTSFPIKAKLLARAIQQQQVVQVQQSYIVAWAITEVAALLGLLDFFQGSDPYYYVLFIISACGQILHFPRRKHVLDATFGRTY